jgi:uncharacterized Zn-binding protein involved in type VI secretion
MSDPIAARKGDHHLCPQHVGADILPACAPTILVGGQPAARVTDLVKCEGGPVDIIQIGEPTVLLEGKQAARFGDGTNHGGLIDEGCSTVVIGSMTDAAKRMRLMARLQLIDAARKKVATMPNGPERDKLNNATNRLAQNNKAVEDARLVSNVYNTSGAPEGWTRLGPSDMPPELRNATFHDPKSGFYADVYRSNIDGSYRLIMRGTEMDTWKQWDGNDWLWGNLSQGTGFESTQYTQAVELSRQFAEAYGGNGSIAGHSLGGGLASAGALAAGATDAEAWGEVGQCLGLAYQLADDLCDAVSSVEVAGKPVRRDETLGRPNAALLSGENPTRQRLVALILRAQTRTRELAADPKPLLDLIDELSGYFLKTTHKAASSS